MGQARLERKWRFHTFDELRPPVHRWHIAQTDEQKKTNGQMPGTAEHDRRATLGGPDTPGPFGAVPTSDVCLWVGGGVL